MKGLVRHRGPVVVEPPTITLEPITVRWAGARLAVMFEALKKPAVENVCNCSLPQYNVIPST
jgi:hypothetical protein